MAKNDDETVEIGVERSKTTVEMKQEKATAGKDAAPEPRDPKEAHKQAAKLAREQGRGAEFYTRDLKAPAMHEKGKDELVSTRLLYDWHDGQGLLHEHGKILDLPWNEAKKLIAEGRAERAKPPKLETTDK